MILMIEYGIRRAFGPKDDILREILMNHKDVLQPGGTGGVT